MFTIATVTPNLRPGYDRIFLESLSNRRENVPLIVVVVGDRTWSYEQNQSTVMFKTVCDLSAITRRKYVLHGRTTNRVWSHHHSCVVAPPVVRDCVSSSRTISSSTSHKLFRLVARPNGDASHDLHLQSLAKIGGTCKRAISNDWRRWKVWPIVVNRPTSCGDQWPIVPPIVTT